MLTDTACRNAKHKAKPYKLSDGGGLRLFVTPTAKLWNMAYRFGGKQKKLSFGAYPDVKLTDARAKRDAAKVQLANGINPGSAKQEAKRVQAAALTFGEWADAWLEKERQLWDQRTMNGKDRFVAYLAGPVGEDGKRIPKEFGPLLIPAVKRPDVLIFLKKFEQEGTLETRDRVRSTGENICTYADVEGTDYNPFRNLGKQLMANVSEPRPALTDPEAVATLFQTIAAPFERARFKDVVGHAQRFISLTVVRPGEIATAEWSDFDFTRARWTISAEKMKMEKEHVVPLSRQALAILEQMKRLTGQRKFGSRAARTRRSPTTRFISGCAILATTPRPSIARTVSVPRSRRCRMPNATATKTKCGTAT